MCKNLKKIKIWRVPGRESGGVLGASWVVVGPPGCVSESLGGVSNLDLFGAEVGPVRGRFGAKFGPIWIKVWANVGPILDQVLSNCGPIWAIVGPM